MGIALGMMIGLIPKDSLIPYAIGLIALFTPANLLCVAISAVVFSWVGVLLDPVTHQFGTWILTLELLESTWSTLFQLPIVPWTRFENTVVMGSFCAGLILAIPVYALSKSCFEKFGSTVFKLFIQTRIARWIIGEPATHLQKS